MLDISEHKKEKVFDYLKSKEGSAWLETFLAISRGLPIIARRKMPFIRYSYICGIYTDDDYDDDYNND